MTAVKWKGMKGSDAGLLMGDIILLLSGGIEENCKNPHSAELVLWTRC
jgi:hypothetical protein